MKYTLLAIIVACVVIFIASGCAVYYPTSYRAFIPRILDSDYKEYQRLCKEEVGKVVYARPVMEDVKLEDMDSRHKELYKLSNNILVVKGSINSPELVSVYIAGFYYYTSWTQKSFSMHDDSKNYIICEPLLYGKDWEEEHEILNKMAFENKEYIGKEYEKTIFYTDWSDSDMEYILRKATNFKTRKSR